MSSNSRYEEGDRIPHDEFRTSENESIPLNIWVKDAKTGEKVIRCPRCDEQSLEDEFEWVDTAVYAEEIADDGTILYHDIQSVTLECPNCERLFTAH